MLVTHDSEPAMPPKSDKMAAASIELIRKWIDQGALENSGSKISCRTNQKKSFKLQDASNSRPFRCSADACNRMSLEPHCLPQKTKQLSLQLPPAPGHHLVAIAGQKQVLTCTTQKPLNTLQSFLFLKVFLMCLKFSRNGSLLIGRWWHWCQSREGCHLGSQNWQTTYSQSAMNLIV